MTNQILNPHLDGDPFSFEGQDPACLLIHGFTATTSEVRPMGEYLHGLGYAVNAPLLAGHNTIPSDINPVTWQDWLANAEAGYLALAQQHSQVVVAGESMGGLLALLLAAKYPQITGLALFAPALRVRGLYGANVLQYFKAYLDKDLTDVNPLWSGYGNYPVRGLAQLNKLQHETWRRLPQVRQPTLLVMAGRDDSVNPRTAGLIHRRIGSARLETVWMPDSTHVVLLSDQRDEVNQRFHQFLQEITAD